tara:strand:+ start:401 stop:1378 length:978 start_codon:yes stop_codon:yes gene_type:complete
MTKQRIAIIGAGLSGVYVGFMIKQKYDVDIFEKSREVGGRMSTRVDPPFAFDHGAQFFRIKTVEFKKFASKLFDERIIRPWNFRHAHFKGNNLKNIEMLKDNFFVGVPNMDSIVKHISKSNRVVLSTKIIGLKKKKNKWQLYDQNKKTYAEYDWVILTLPSEQSLELLTTEISFYQLVKKIKMKGCFSLMVGNRESIVLDYDAATIEKSDIAWLAMNDSKPCRQYKNSFLINSSFEFANRKLNAPRQEILERLLNTTSKLIKHELSNSTMIKLHQWRYVEAKNYPNQNYFIDHNQKVAVCGDWLVNSRVEGAFISAHQLSKEIMA